MLRRILAVLPAVLLGAAPAAPWCFASAAPPAHMVEFPPRALHRQVPPPSVGLGAARAATSPGNFQVTNVAIGQLPVAAVISPDEHWAYVISAASGELDVLDLTTFTLAQRVPLPYFMTTIRISPAGDKLFIGAATPPLTGYPTDGTCPRVTIALTASSVLIIDTATLRITGQVPASDLIIDLVLSPDGNTLVASTFSGLVLIDLRTLAPTEIATTGAKDQLAAVFASNATKVFAVHVFNELTVFDLPSHAASSVTAPPGGYQYLGNNVSATPAGDTVFVDACNPVCGMAVLDSATASIKKVLPNISQDAGLLVTFDGRRAFLPDFAYVLDLGSLEIVGHGTLPGFGGVAGVLSPDQSRLYDRPNGSPDFSLVYYSSPVSYDLATVDTTSLATVAYTVLDPRPLKCSWSSPLAMSRSGRLLVAPNPTLSSVSLVKVLDAPPPPVCMPSASSLCLNGGRFEVTATYSTADGRSGAAQVVPLSPVTGYLWFFSAANVEAVVKVLDGCALNGNYWVFAAGLTDVNVTITVTDTLTGIFKTYTNAQGTAFLPVQDTGALPVCP
jgi:hypothetical protein